MYNICPESGMAQVSSPPSSSAPPGHVFSDEELSEIFQIDFGQIFGNPEAGLKSSYRGLQGKPAVSRAGAGPGTQTACHPWLVTLGRAAAH